MAFDPFLVLAYEKENEGRREREERRGAERYFTLLLVRLRGVGWGLAAKHIRTKQKVTYMCTEHK